MLYCSTVKARRERSARGLPPTLARVPFGLIRPVDAREVYAYPGPEFQRLVERGVLRRVATGYYAIVPPSAHGLEWMPSLEAVAYGIGAADYGPAYVTLMGLSAARLHGGIPRALATAVVAVPKQRPPVALADRPGRITFVRRDVDRLQAERMTTDLGAALVTTIEQTVLDLARRPELGGAAAEARTGVHALWSRVDSEELIQIARAQRLGAAADRARAWAEKAAT